MKLSPKISFEFRRIGREAQPLLVVDHVLDDPEALVAQALSADFYVPDHTHYPGVNARLPEAYYQSLLAGLRAPLEKAFGLSQRAGLDYFGFFALATQEAAGAQPIQKIPHHDCPNPGRLAMVHYLCRGPYGGTGFFRHKATGFESIDASRHEGYLGLVADELDRAPAGSYAGEGMAGYELIDYAELVFDRLVIYRSHVLHSGLLGSAVLPDSPGSGRLTANGFIEARG